MNDKQKRDYKEEIEAFFRDAFFYGLEKHFKVRLDKLSEIDSEYKDLKDADRLHKNECYVVENTENGDQAILVVNKETENLETYIYETDEFAEVLDSEDFWISFYMINRR